MVGKVFEPEKGPVTPGKDPPKGDVDLVVPSNYVSTASGVEPTKAEFDALVESHNRVLEILRNTASILNSQT